MLIIDRVRADLNAAVVSNDMLAKNTLRGVLAAIKNKEIELKSQITGLTEQETESVINKLIKQRQESIDAFKMGGRIDLAEKEKKEQDLLRKYVRDVPTVAALQPVLLKIISDNGYSSMKDMGKILSNLRDIFGNVDGKLVKELAEAVFEGK